MSEQAGTAVIEGRKTYTFTIEFDDGRTKQASITQGRVKLKVLKMLDKAQKTNEWDDLIPVIAAALKITPEEAEEIELWQWQEMGEYMKQAAAVPNESAPTTE